MWLIVEMAGILITNRLLWDSCFCHADRPIASLAFHAQGDLLAVASGHKVLFVVADHLQFFNVQ